MTEVRTSAQDEWISADLRPTYIIRLRAQPGVDAIKALRFALKGLLRHHGLVALSVREERHG
jgi:hypothetical protein